jgi:transposase
MPGRKRGANLEVVSTAGEAETEVREKRTRRTFTAAYKQKILKEVEGASSGTRAAILRREGLYSSHIQKWRAEDRRKTYDERKRGRQKNALTAEMRKLRQENERLQKQLYQANKIIELQKKVSEILGVTLEPIDENE